MKQQLKLLIPVFVFSVLIASCNNHTSEQKPTPVQSRPDSAAPKTTVRDKVITAEEQKALTPDLVLQRLKEGNQRFLANDVTQRDHSALVRDAKGGQYPMAIIFSCMDSRVPVEDVFDCCGDLFVCRVGQCKQRR